jgi:hypothetical protein
MYKAQEGAQDAQAAPSDAEASQEDNVEDVDFEEVK